jgi:hypothetical protein
MVNTDETLENLNHEFNRTTTLLGFLIQQPQISTSLTGIDKTQLNVENYMRVKLASIWSEKMLAQLAKRLDKKTLEDTNKFMDTCIEASFD